MWRGVTCNVWCGAHDRAVIIEFILGGRQTVEFSFIRRCSLSALTLEDSDAASSPLLGQSWAPETQVALASLARDYCLNKSGPRLFTLVVGAHLQVPQGDR